MLGNFPFHSGANASSPSSSTAAGARKKHNPITIEHLWNDPGLFFSLNSICSLFTFAPRVDEVSNKPHNEDNYERGEGALLCTSSVFAASARFLLLHTTAAAASEKDSIGTNLPA